MGARRKFEHRLAIRHLANARASIAQVTALLPMEQRGDLFAIDDLLVEQAMVIGREFGEIIEGKEP